MALHRLTALALAGALALGAAGCGDDSPAPAPSTSSAAASPTPSTTGPAAPVLPDVAARNDAVGAKAFVKYWFEAVSFAMHTGDTRLFMAVSAKDCKTCTNLNAKILSMYRSRQRLVGGGWRVVGVEQDPKSKAPFWRFAVKVSQLPQKVVDRRGKVVSRDPQDQALFYAGVQWRDGFEFMGLERIDD